MTFKINFTYFYNKDAVSLYGEDFQLLLDDINDQVPSNFSANIWYNDKLNGEIMIDIEIKDIQIGKKTMIESDNGKFLEFLFNHNDQKYSLAVKTEYLKLWYIEIT